MFGEFSPKVIGRNQGGALQFIDKKILGAAAASITFSNIIQTYSHLKIFITARGSNAANTSTVAFQFNGDTGANYGNGNVNQTAGTAAAGQAVGQTSGTVGQITAASQTANFPGCVSIEIPFYSNNTFFKNLVSLANDAASSGTQQFYYVAYWANLSPINSISILNTSGNFIAGSLFSIYGII